MEAGAYNSRIEIQVTNNNVQSAEIQYVPFMTVWAYVNGISGKEFWEVNAGGVAENIVNVTVRYNKQLMFLAPQTTRFILDGFTYELISPPDDVQFLHKQIKFKAVRIV